MREQVDFSQTPEFRRFMEGLSNLKASAVIHGVFIDVHPFWREIVVRQRASGVPPNADVIPWLPEQPLEDPVSYDLDVETTPELWKGFCKRLEKDSRYPFIVTLWALPMDRRESEAYSELTRYTYQHPFFVRVQQRPMAELATGVEGGLRISASRAGALGGFLKDQRSRAWAVTCGHVAQVRGASWTLEDVGGSQYIGVGTVTHTNFPTLAAVPSKGLCNPYVAGGNATTDTALLELGDNFTAHNTVKGLGTIDEIYDRTRLGSGSPVCMSGVRSGVEDYVIGGYGVTLKVGMHTGAGSSCYCVSDVFQFSAPRTAPLWMPARVAQWLAPRPLPGDSGSWVCFRKDFGVCAYFGNLIAVQGLTGIATFADSLLSWASHQHQLTLSVL